jgi:hypothetical protein
MAMIRSTIVTAAAGVVALIGSQVAGADAQPFSKSQVHHVTATVKSIDKDSREIELTGPKGNTSSYVVGPEVKNFNQIQVGDRVVLSYYEGLGAQVMPPGTAPAAPTETTTTSVAPGGARPGANLNRTITSTVTIEAVGKDAKSVSFKRADGTSHKVAIEDPDAQKFVHTLKPGDSVQIRYSEATAVSVHEAPKK